jgi:hypothetical protein
LTQQSDILPSGVKWELRSGPGFPLRVFYHSLDIQIKALQCIYFHMVSGGNDGAGAVCPAAAEQDWQTEDTSSEGHQVNRIRDIK